MRRCPVLALLMIGFLAFSTLADSSEPVAAPLHAGEQFPNVSGMTLTGKLLELPAAAMGKPAVVVFSFSRTAGKDAHSWNEHLAGGSSAVLVYEVVVLESVPKLFRGMATSGIRSSMSRDQQERTIVLYRDEHLWKQRLAASDDKRAYVMLSGKDGRIRWSNTGAYSDSEFARLKREIELALTLHQ